MSEKILNALMQLFAIVAYRGENLRERNVIVELFLKQQLNRNLVDKYLNIYRDYIAVNQKRFTQKEKRTTSSSVKILKICTEINEELSQIQKLVVIIRLLEFVNSAQHIDINEVSFADTVGETFNIEANEYQLLKNFVFEDFKSLLESEQLLIVNGVEDFQSQKNKHIFSENFHEEVKIINIYSSKLFIVKYIGKEEVILNGNSVSQQKTILMTNGSSLRSNSLKPLYYSDIISEFYHKDLAAELNYEVKNIEYEFRAGDIGLHHLNFTETSGKLIGIMGSSGAGKTTLLNVLSGILPPSSGEVTINGINIHREKGKLEGVIGYVSQDDLLIEDLTVFENLYFNAKLCFSYYSGFKLVRSVLSLLQSLGLYEIRNMKVGSPLNKKISGGQRKRLNIALELIREPSVLFLDEPTSGLSSRDSRKIIDILKSLTFKGKLVFVVIHQPSSDIFKMFDKLCILDTGGYLIYSGNTVDSISYFKSKIEQVGRDESECRTCGNVNSEEVFDIIDSRILDEYGNFTQTRKIAPNEWGDIYKKHVSSKNKKTSQKKTFKLPKISFKILSSFKQLIVFIQRDILAKFTNKQYLVINLLETPVLAFILAYMLRYYKLSLNNEGYSFFNNENIPAYIFMSIIVAIFIGLTVSADEIIKDRKILKREAFLNLSWMSYLFSKVVILIALSAFQSLVFVLIGNTILDIKEMYLSSWIILFTCMVNANLIGLNISDSFKKVINVYILIPFLIIPQLILSGIIVNFDKLNPKISSVNSIPFYGELMVTRWAYEALTVEQYKNNKYEKNFFYYDQVMNTADYKKNYWIPELRNKLIDCERALNTQTDTTQLISNLKLLVNEISKELINNKHIGFDNINDLNVENINLEVCYLTQDYLTKLNRYYIRLYNKINRLKNKRIEELTLNPENKEKFLALKNAYKNENLSGILTNNRELYRIVEHNENLYQKINMIYKMPENKFIKAHFYASVKNIFGIPFNTFWVNLIIIWTTNIILFITLYYRVLKRIIHSLGNIKSWKDKF